MNKTTLYPLALLAASLASPLYGLHYAKKIAYHKLHDMQKKGIAHPQAIDTLPNFSHYCFLQFANFFEGLEYLPEPVGKFTDQHGYDAAAVWVFGGATLEDLRAHATNLLVAYQLQKILNIVEDRCL